MKTVAPLIVLLLLFLACSDTTRVTLAGPSVSDQLKSRGYIETEADTTAPDTSGLVPDTLRR